MKKKQLKRLGRGEETHILLEYLQTILGDTDLEFSYPPARVIGGYETAIYRFRLENAPEAYTRPLILRVYKEHSGRPEFETVVHYTLNGLGYPVPRVYFTCSDQEKWGTRFIVMEEAQGELLLKKDQETMLKIFTDSHMFLHRIPVDKIVSALEKKKIHKDEYSFKGRFDWLTRTIRDSDLQSMLPGLDWVTRHRPDEPSRRVVCHTDFHPGNIMVKDGRVSEVLDWSGFMLGDPALDIGFTKVLGTVAAPLVWPEIDWEHLVEQYYESYQSMNPLDDERVRYFEAFRLLQAMVEGLMGHDAWSQSAIFSKLSRTFKEKTSMI